MTEIRLHRLSRERYAELKRQERFDGGTTQGVCS
jgi:hypothetical protein